MENLQNAVTVLYTNTYKLGSRSISATHASGHQAFTRFAFRGQWRHVNVIVQLILCVSIAVPGQELDNVGVFDSEDGVIIKILAGFVELLSRYRLISLRQYLVKG